MVPFTNNNSQTDHIEHLEICIRLQIDYPNKFYLDDVYLFNCK